MSPMVRQPLTIEHALLGFLREKPMHGYEIHRRMSDPEGLGLVWRVKQSQLYALLSRLKEKGYIDAGFEQQGNRPPRKIFHLTKKGTETFLDWVEAPVEHGREMRLNFMVKLFFARKEGTEIVGQLISRQREMCRNWQELPREKPALDSNAFKWLIDEFRLGQIGAMLHWLDEIEIKIQNSYSSLNDQGAK